MPAGPGQSHERFESIFAEVEAPFAFVDLDALWANADEMLGRAGEKPIRVASKSVRCRALQELILRRPGFAGTMTFTLPETLWLAEQGFEDLLLAYPTTDGGALEELALRSAAHPEQAPIVTVDSPEHLDQIESVLGAGAAPVRVCIELDASWWAAGGRFKVGAKRSPDPLPGAGAGAGPRRRAPRADRPRRADGLRGPDLGRRRPAAGTAPARRGDPLHAAPLGGGAGRAARRGGRRRARGRRAGDRQRRRHRQPRADRRRGGGDRGDGGLGLLRPGPVRPLQPLHA